MLCISLSVFSENPNHPITTPCYNITQRSQSTTPDRVRVQNSWKDFPGVNIPDMDSSIITCWNQPFLDTIKNKIKDKRFMFFQNWNYPIFVGPDFDCLVIRARSKVYTLIVSMKLFNLPRNIIMCQSNSFYMRKILVAKEVHNLLLRGSNNYSIA